MTAARVPVLLVGDSLSLGGTEGQFVEVACGLDRSRWNVHVTCLRAEGPLRARLLSAGLAPWSSGSGSFKSPRFAGAIVRLARSARARRVRVVHCFDFYSNVLGVLAARLARVPAVIASQRDLGTLLPPLGQRVSRLMLRLADHVLVNSEAVSERVRTYPGIRASRVALVPNGVDMTRFAPKPAPPGGRDGRVVVGTLANLRPEKGVPDLVRAAALVRQRCPESRLVVWGGGSLREELEQLVQALGLGETVELRGPTTEPEAALRGLDVFVLPSLSEACSNVLLEAMATALPVVATRVGGNPYLVSDEESGLLVPPGNPPELAKAIIRLVEDPALATRLGRGARGRVRDHFAMAVMLDRVQQLYDRALAGASG